MPNFTSYDNYTGTGLTSDTVAYTSNYIYRGDGTVIETPAEPRYYYQVDMSNLNNITMVTPIPKNKRYPWDPPVNQLSLNLFGDEKI